MPASTQSSSNTKVPVLGKRKSGTLQADSASPSDTPGLSCMFDKILGAVSSDNEAEAEATTVWGAKRAEKHKGRSKDKERAHATTTVALTVETETEDSASELSDGNMGAKPRRGHVPVKSQWAKFHYGNEPKAKKKQSDGNLIWQWSCSWCGTHQSLPRSSAKIKAFDDEPKAPTLSNLISHLDNCSKLPKEHKFEVWQHPQQLDGQVGSFASQHQMMAGFVQRGIENPQVEVTRKGFRERFVMGIIQDDLPFSVGEKAGMNRLLTYILPKGWEVPNSSMTSQDLECLHEAMNLKLPEEMKTSKSSVYAFTGVVASWITNSWDLKEYPLDLIPVDGDHSGTASSKAIFQEIHCRQVDKKSSKLSSVY
ncbi:hypothetical protein BC835DRAFT_1418265 [Cytidiella melzeri]|nr:hypothetical protein BC835DRAFT_1418265 [Cytidiella melzeri]